MTRQVQDAINIMAVALGRRNANDPDSNNNTFFTYLKNFVSLKMPNDTKLFESFGALVFTIDETNTTGVYTFNDVGADADFINLSQEAYISLLNPVNNSVSWNKLPIYQDPGEFFAIWGLNNTEILVPGFPTGVLFYGNEFTFRTIPNTSYQVTIYGYKKYPDYPNPDVDLQYDYWLRYVAYGSALDYARDYRYEPSSLARIEATFRSERKQMLTRTHNQIKLSRSMPKF